MTIGARARVSAAALRHNLQLIRQHAPGCRVMAAIKGNAYGHGLITAARALDEADSFAVARLAEARELRAAGITAPLVLLAGCATPDELSEAGTLGCEIVIHSQGQLPALEAARSAALTCWLKVDTGMHRLGFAPAEVSAVLERLAACTAVAEVRLMTHFATADDPADPLAGQQAAAFLSLSRGFDGAVSVENSAMLLSGGSRPAGRWGNRGETWVRPGIALYGISPFAGACGTDFGLRPAMTFTSRLLDTKPVTAGERVGYGGTWQATQDTVIGIVAAGYADGYTRFLPSGTPVLINGRRAGLAGIVSMDVAAVDLGPDARDRVGDEVILWGEGLPVEEVARHAGTIAYQLVTGVMHREAPCTDA